MSAYLLNVFFKGSHLLFVAQHADDIVACHDAELGKQRPDHLQMTIADAVEHHGVDVFKYNMFLYQSIYKFVIGCKVTKSREQYKIKFVLFLLLRLVVTIVTIVVTIETISCFKKEFWF